MKEHIGQRDPVANGVVYRQMHKNVIKRSSFKTKTVKIEFIDAYMTAISLIQINQLFYLVFSVIDNIFTSD